MNTIKQFNCRDTRRFCFKFFIYSPWFPAGQFFNQVRLHEKKLITILTANPSLNALISLNNSSSAYFLGSKVRYLARPRKSDSSFLYMVFRTSYCSLAVDRNMYTRSRL